MDNSFDTSTPQGNLIFQMFAALAEFERNLIRERTMAGLTAARARGRYGGRPRKMDDKAIKMAATLVKENEMSMAEIVEKFGVSRSTLNKALRRLKDENKVQRKPGRPPKNSNDTSVSKTKLSITAVLDLEDRPRKDTASKKNPINPDIDLDI